MIVERQVDGIEMVYRDKGEPAVAMITRVPRRWLVSYRESVTEGPSEHSISFPTHAEAIAEIERTVGTCSDYQLGLAERPEVAA